MTKVDVKKLDGALPFEGFSHKSEKVNKICVSSLVA